MNKAYATNSVWNLRPDDDEDAPVEPVSATNNRLEFQIPYGGVIFKIVATGAFEWSAPITATTQIYGTVSEWKAYLNETLFAEEIFPAGTSANAWQNGSYAFQMSLLSGNDYFAGSPLRHDDSGDGVRGGDGNDVFMGYGSVGESDYFFGEGGIDTSVYQGKLSEYVIVSSDDIWDGRANDGTRASGYRVTDLVSSRDDTDELVGVERLQFSDVTLALDIDGIAAEAYRIYKAAFDRQPDLTGLGFWIKNMDAGMGLEAVAQEFINSAEFIRMYGANPTDEQFVDLLYANVLDRQADQSGYDFWIGALDRGLTRAGLLAEFSESRENVANVAPLIEDGIQYVAFIG
ncbi:DUF4214 domain-containing protein [Orrella daihaiensis]|uniref:DUF4214 domain-containing protein n=1 Tax=Orrella daihaiensis TaxID=2782176 RepID=A0ABY4AQS5_9BURK|nr:DUF4214 domain-containing protein [Orrella daihaiensis]UOD50404.1 DUF4214 domain-containing protein [Orrella daihaiensis]